MPRHHRDKGDGCNNVDVAASLNTSLQDRLDRITQNTRALVQPERLAVSEKATEDLFNTGIEDRALKVGAHAPAFTLEDALTHKFVSSADLLALGPVVVNFFRGRWDPYCVTELEAWRDLQGDLRRRGALFVAISPQTTRQNNFTLQQHGLPYPLLSDPGAATAEDFGVAYSIPEAGRRYYQSILINIPFNNAGLSYHNASEASWRLPLPAIFVIAPDGRIFFAEGHADFRVRPEPADILAVLDR
jgi:peroxiredoxin